MASSLFLTDTQWHALQERLKVLEEKLSSVIHDHQERAQLQKEHTALSAAHGYAEKIRELDANLEALQEDLAETNDQEMVLLIREELETLQKEKIFLLRDLEDTLYPSSPENDRSIFIEIRAGAGGLEASLFAGEMARMYSMYAEKNRWHVSVSSSAETDIGGCREIVLHIEGKKVYEKLRHEAGVHRVQRVPATEGSGRVHTSTVTVAVLPEAEEVEVSINPADLRVDTYRASGAGGQHVNKTDSAIRITHIPSGIVVSCQEDRSQHKNRAKAMKMLQARLFAAEKEKQSKQISQMRKEMSGSADRADKVRTYNFPQNRVTDHQVNLTINRLDFIMLGGLDEIIDALVQKARSDRATSPYFASFLTLT